MYKKILDNIALQRIEKPVHFPDYRLMVGHAEDLSPQRIIKYVDFLSKAKYEMLHDREMTYEEIQENLASGKLTIDDFFQNVYPLGDPIVKE